MFLDLQRKFDDAQKKSPNVKNEKAGPSKISLDNNDSLSSETESIISSVVISSTNHPKSDFDSDGENNKSKNNENRKQDGNAVEINNGEKFLAGETKEKEKLGDKKEISIIDNGNDLNDKRKDNGNKIDGTGQSEYYDENIQLLGPNHNKKMIEIEPDIYCIKKKIKYEPRQRRSYSLRTMFDGRHFQATGSSTLHF
ncbi:myb-like protein X [Microplitis mediator]|uniref:myb-like protein X n=1 Tax=Microplitis mediator TaxID=375433 RepID=UPI002552B6BA|nr:myb-like protein X [Microplitis mediator]